MVEDRLEKCCDGPSWTALDVPTEPKPIFLGAAVVVAVGFPVPIWPKPSLDMPMPRRSSSLGVR